MTWVLKGSSALADYLIYFMDILYLLVDLLYRELAHWAKTELLLVQMLELALFSHLSSLSWLLYCRSAQGVPCMISEAL